MKAELQIRKKFKLKSFIFLNQEPAYGHFNPERLITTVVDNSLIFFFSEKIRFDISCKLSDWQMIDMNHVSSFSLKTHSHQVINSQL